MRAHRERERRAKNKSRRRRRRRRREWFMRSKLFVVLSFKTRLYSYSFDHRKSHSTKSCSFLCWKRNVSDTTIYEYSRLKNKGNKKDPPPPAPKKTPPFLPLNLLVLTLATKKNCVLRLSAWEDDGVEGNEEEEDAARGVVVFFLVLISRGALFALHRPKPRGVNERRDRRERKNCWSSRVQREIALKFITTTTTTARSKRVTTTRCCHYPC